MRVRPEFSANFSPVKGIEIQITADLQVFTPEQLGSFMAAFTRVVLDRDQTPEPPNNSLLLASVLRTLRQRSGLTTKNWANLVETSYTSLHRWEKGVAIPGPYHENAIINRCVARKWLSQDAQEPINEHALRALLVQERNRRDPLKTSSSRLAATG